MGGNNSHEKQLEQKAKVMRDRPERNLILGFATGIKIQDFYTFAVSARKNCKDNVDIAIITDVSDENISSISLKYNIIIIPTESSWLLIQKYLVAKMLYRIQISILRLFCLLKTGSRFFFETELKKCLSRWMYPIAGRWFEYENFLKINLCYTNVMISDVRDVFFQADPFANIDNSELHLFAQNGMKFSADFERPDNHWYHSMYGVDEFNKAIGHPIICAGTIIGCSKTILRLVSIIVIEMTKRVYKIVDQPMLNKVIIDGGFNNVRIYSSNEGPVLTLCGDHSDLWRLEDEKVLVAGRPIPVVHMYDRVEVVKDLVTRKYNAM